MKLKQLNLSKNLSKKLAKSFLKFGSTLKIKKKRKLP